MKDAASQRWDSYYDTDRDFGLMTSQALTQILTYVDASLEKTCLDIGCGTGQLTRELSHRGYECVGVDLSESAISMARSLTDQTTRLTYLRQDVTHLDPKSLPRQEFSLITCKLVYAFIQDKMRLLDDVDGLLAPGGTFVIITPVYRNDRKKSPISVDLEQTLHQLRKKFSRVIHFKGVGVVTVVCQR